MSGIRWVCLAASLASACASGQPGPEGLRARLSGLPSCASEMALPASVLDGTRSGIVGVEYFEDGLGVPGNFLPLPGFPGRGSPLYDETVAQIARCRRLGTRGAVHVERILTLAPPPTRDVSAEIVDDETLVAAKGTPPSSQRCEPAQPPVFLPEFTGYVVHSNGVASDPVFIFKDEAEEKRIRENEPVVRAWLAGCHFVPGHNLAGEPVTVRIHRQQHAEHGQEMINSGELTRPKPLCRAHPDAPRAAMEQGITGMVLVSYIVHANGSVSVPILMNPTAPRVLYRAVREWLESCTFEPSRQKDGTAVPVRMIQPFNFKVGH